jgi:hypothetical protein
MTNAVRDEKIMGAQKLNPDHPAIFVVVEYAQERLPRLEGFLISDTTTVCKRILDNQGVHLLFI